MGYKTIYHGSSVVVEKPIYHYDGANTHNDYGLGFYCTQSLDMAKEWANRGTRSGYVSKYQFDERGLKILDLTDKKRYDVLNWLAILLHYRSISENDRLDYADELSFLDRYYVDVEEYDVVIGYRADDAYFRFPMMFVRGVLTLEKLEEIYLLGDLGKQYVIVSQKAFDKIQFVDAVLSEPLYFERYRYRKNEADNSYRELERSERGKKGTRIRDLMKGNYDQVVLRR